MTAWQARDWGRMHATLQVRRRERVTIQRLRDLLAHKTITRWRLVAAKQASTAAGLKLDERSVGALIPEMVTVVVDAWYRSGRDLYHRAILLNVVLESEAREDYGQPPRDPATGRWGVNETSALRESLVGTLSR